MAIVKLICVLLMYLFINLSDALSASREYTQALKSEYKDYLTNKNTIQCDALQVAHTNTVDELVSKICGKGYSFEESEDAIVAFKQSYVNKMIKITGRIKKINYNSSTLIFENNVDCLWNVVSVRAIVDNPTLYNVGEKVSIVGRCLGLNSLCELYIDGGQIEQELPNDSVETVTITKKYDKAMTAKEILDIYHTYGDGNILYNQFAGKTIQITGYVHSVASDKVHITSSKYTDMYSPHVVLYCPGAKFLYSEGETATITAKYVNCTSAYNYVNFEIVK